MSKQGDKAALARPPWNAFCIIGAKMVSAGCRARMEAATKKSQHHGQLHNKPGSREERKQSVTHVGDAEALYCGKRNFAQILLRLTKLH